MGKGTKRKGKGSGPSARGIRGQSPTQESQPDSGAKPADSNSHQTGSVDSLSLSYSLCKMGRTTHVTVVSIKQDDAGIPQRSLFRWLVSLGIPLEQNGLSIHLEAITETPILPHHELGTRDEALPWGKCVPAG